MTPAPTRDALLAALREQGAARIGVCFPMAPWAPPRVAQAVLDTPLVRALLDVWEKGEALHHPPLHLLAEYPGLAAFVAALDAVAGALDRSQTT